MNGGMTRYADPERCPDCLAAMPYGSPRCPRCGLVLEGPLAAQLYSTLSQADTLLGRMRAVSVPAHPPPAPAPVTVPAAGPSRPGRGGFLGGASVPKILLGLGALCLLVAALVFLAVTWSLLGVGGRTAILVGFTAVGASLTAWAAHRALRAAAESLAVLSLGLLSLDLAGARSAGWLGDPTTAGFLVVLGTTVAVAGAAAATVVRRTPARALVGAELLAGVGVALAVAGAVATDRLPRSAGLTLAVLTTAAVAFAANRARLAALAVTTSLVALGSWMLLALTSWDRALQHPSLQQLWLGAEVWPLLATAALAGGLVVVTGLPSAVRLGALGVAELVLAAAVLAPAADETVTGRTVAAAVLLAALAALALGVPQPWRRSLAVPGTVGLVWMVAAGLSLGGLALLRILAAGADLWTGSAGDRLPARGVPAWELAPWLLPVVVVAVAAALVAAARTFGWADRAVGPLADPDVLAAVGAATAALTLAGYPAPIWLVLAALLVSGGGFVARWLRHRRALTLALAAAFLALAVPLSLHAPWLTLAATGVVLVASGTVHLRAGRLETSVGAGVVLAAALAGVAWTVGALVGAAGTWVAAAALLVLAAATLGGPYVDERLRVTGPPGQARLGTEVGALATAGVVSVAGVAAAAPGSGPTWLAVYLTATGTAAAAMALLRSDRRRVGWLGGLLLAAASWVRLADLGVEAPEAYTLPSAVALVVVGLVHLRRNPAAGTMAALSPGLLLGLVPSLLWVVAEPIGLRSLLLGVGCLLLVVGGVRLRWSAPVAHGAVIGALLVLRLATPVAEAVPRWALIGAAGAVLVAMGITWEARVADARRVAGYVRRLR